MSYLAILYITIQLQCLHRKVQNHFHIIISSVSKKSFNLATGAHDMNIQQYHEC